MFEKNQLSLSSLLLYSLDSIEKIKRIVGDKPAYIVGGYPGFQDISMAVELKLAFLSGNPVENLKYSKSNTFKKFLHVNSFPYMVFSQKMKKDKDIEANLAKILAAHPHYSKWRVEIDGEEGGRGTAVIAVDNVNMIQTLRNTESEDERLKMVPDLTTYLRSYFDGYVTPSCQKIYYDTNFLRDVITSRGGYAEAIPKGNISTIGLVCFISPSGKFYTDKGTLKYLTSYELIQTDKFFKVGYIWPQRELPLKSLESLYTKLAQKVFDQGIFGYITILLTICSSGPKNYKVCIDRILPYYDEFLNTFEMLNLMVQPNERPRCTAVIIPRIQNLCFDRHMTYQKFFDRCRERNLQFDVKDKTGTIFLLSDNIERRSVGLINVGSISAHLELDRERAIKYANQTLNNIASLFDPEVTEDKNQKNDVVSYSLAVESLFSIAKK